VLRVALLQMASHAGDVAANAEAQLCPWGPPDTGCAPGDVRIAPLRGRAWENLVAVAMANYATPQHDGRWCAFGPDGVAARRPALYGPIAAR
jgi:predicted amidohydrolase